MHKEETQWPPQTAPEKIHVDEAWDDLFASVQNELRDRLRGQIGLRLINTAEPHQLALEIWRQDECKRERMRTSYTVDERPDFTQESNSTIEVDETDEVDPDELNEMSEQFSGVEMWLNEQTIFSLRMELRKSTEISPTAGIRIDKYQSITLSHAIALSCIRNITFVSRDHRILIADALIYHLAGECRSQFAKDGNDMRVSLDDYIREHLMGLPGLESLYQKIVAD